MKRAAGLLVAAALLALPACNGDAERAARMTGGDAGRGREAIRKYGCYSCHTIPGVAGADGLVGPPLDRVASRSYIGGVLVNTPDNMVKWIQDPPGVDPKTAMPNLGVSDEDVRNIACYLYTLR